MSNDKILPGCVAVEVVDYCPHCGNSAPQKLALDHSFEDREVYDAHGNRVKGFGLDCTYYARVCSSCQDLILYLESEVQDDVEVVYPTAHILDDAVPEPIRVTFEEAVKVQKISPGSYAVLIRRALEAICEDRGAKGKVLHAQLKDLADRGEIPKVLAEATSLLRAIGNAGAHHSKERVTVPMTWHMAKLFKAVVEYVYVAPNLVSQFTKAIGGDDSSNASSGDEES